MSKRTAKWELCLSLQLCFSIQVNQAVETDSSLKQWVDLEVLSTACITLPDTCGPEGAAVAVWVKMYECETFSDGFLSSYDPRTTGFMFFCFSTNPKIRYGFFPYDLFVKLRRVRNCLSNPGGISATERIPTKKSHVKLITIGFNGPYERRKRSYLNPSTSI